jgi:peptidyl-prolyl cis-trans isomerase C
MFSDAFRKSIVLFALLGVVTLAGCKPSTSTEGGKAVSGAPAIGALEVSGEVVATVNGQQIGRNMLDSAVRAIPPQVRAQLDKQENMSQLVDSLVANDLLYQEALKQGIQYGAEVKADVALAERNALAEAYVRKEIEKRLTDDRIKAWYDEHLVQFAKPQVHLARIVVQSKAEGDAIKSAINQGADFSQLAAAKSLDQATGARGGDIGWIPVESLNEAFKGTLGAIQPGMVVGPLDIGGTFHIIKILERKEEGRPLADVRDDIVSMLQQEIREEIVKEIRAKSTVMVTANTPGLTAPGASAKPEAKIAAPSVPSAPPAPGVPASAPTSTGAKSPVPK